jgi:DNA-binding SARP family transcriptional activator/WD40 repeat protein
MRIAVLGPLEVLTDDGVPLAVPGAKERLLLAVLAAAAPGVVSAERLVDSLWDGDPPASARKSLQAHVVRLRSSLEPGRPKGSPGRYVVRRGAGYALAVDRGSIDGLHIGDVAARGHARLASGELAEAERQLTAAVDLWRGEPYADWPDAPFADAERRRLTEVRAGAVAGLLEARLQLGRHAHVLPELERLVVEEPLREDWWRLLMLALYRAGRQADALAAGRRARTLLAEELGVDPGPALRATETAVLSQDPALESPAVPPLRAVEDGSSALDGTAQGACPYKGLAAYQVEDAALFHGRERLVAGLVARLVDAPILLVSGPSGAGKSSAVRAGLVPALTAGVLPGSRRWRSVIVTPGPSPVDVLADLTGDRPPDEPVVLVCDQFEELWAPGVEPAERGAFLDAVLGLIDDGIVIRCVVVVRGDHVGRLAEHATFAERAGPALVLVPPLTEPEIRAIVREPASAVGLGVDPDLVDAAVADVLGQAGALPLLSTALVGTWQRRRGDQLTLAGYLEAGGVEGALIRSAEAAYGALDESGQHLARRLFVRLADTDDGGTLVRRAVPLDEVDLSGARRGVVESFVNRRLLALDGDRLEVAHEALLTAWPRLRRWLDDDAAGRAVRRHLAPAAREWEAGGRPGDELYRGARLAAALDWAAGPDAGVTPVEQRFLDASRETAQAELTAARQRADREAAARHRTRRLAAGLAAVLIVALVAALLAVRAQRRAQEASVVADANRLAALSTTVGRLDLSLLLAAQAVRLADTPETQDGLLAALSENGRAERVIGFDGFPYAAHIADRGRVLFYDAGTGLVSRQVGASGSPRPVVGLPPDPDGPLDGWRVVAPSPADDVLLAAGQTGEGVPWVRTVAADGTLRTIAEGPAVGGLPMGGSFTGDGRSVQLLVAAPDPDRVESSTRWSLATIDVADGTVHETGLTGAIAAPIESLSGGLDSGVAVLADDTGAAGTVVIDVADGRAAVATETSRPATGLEFRPLPSGAAQFWDDGGVTLFDRRGVVVQQLEAHQEPVRDAVVAPDMTWAVTAGDGPLVVLWDIDPMTGRWSQRDVLSGHDGDVRDLSLDPTGSRLYTMSFDGTIIAWDMSPDGTFGRSYPGLDGRWVSYRPQFVEPDGLLVAATRTGASIGEAEEGPGPGTESVAAVFIDAGTGDVVDEVVVGDTLGRFGAGSSVSVSPDGRLVAVTWLLGTTVLDTDTRTIVEEIALPPTGSVEPDGWALPATAVFSAGWTPDGETLLLGSVEGGDIFESTEGHLVPVDVGTWEIGEPIAGTGAAQSIEVSPDGSLLAMASAAGEIVLLDATSLDVLERIPLADGERGTDLSFSSDGRLLAAGGESGGLYVLDTGTWDRIAAPTVLHEGAVVQVEWLRDDRTVVTAGIDGAATLFDVERGLVRGRPLATTDAPGNAIAFLVPEPTDQLVVLHGERAGRRFPLEPSVWLEEACAVAGRDLTQTEWDRYLPDQPYERTCT